MRDAPLNYRVADYADAVRVGDHYRTLEEAGFFDPGRAGHFPIAVERPPAGEDGIAHGIFTARKNGGDSGAYGTRADLQFSFAGDECGVADGDTGNVSDGVKRAGGAVERNA